MAIVLFLVYWVIWKAWIIAPYNFFPYEFYISELLKFLITLLSPDNQGFEINSSLQRNQH
jgi:hypothetical protein